MSAQVNITPEVGQNIPAEHIEEHKPTRTPPTGKALDQLKEVLAQVDREVDDAARVRIGSWVRNFMLTLYGGVRATWGVYNIQGGQWDTLPESDLGRLYNVNLLLQDFTTIKATLERSRIKLKVQPAPAKAADVKAKMSAQVAQRKIDHDLRTEINADFYSREFTYMLCCGSYFRYRGFDKSKGPMEQSALLEPQEVKQPGSFYCQNRDCGASGPVTELKDDMCPKCGGPAVQSDGEILASKAHTGYEDSPAGATCTYSVNPFEVGLPNEAAGPDKAAFLRWEQRARINYIAFKYGVKPSILKGGEPLSPALTALMVIQNYGQSVSTTDKNFGVFRRYWLEPFMYAEVENNDEDLELAGGTKLPTGKLTKFAPHGLYIAKMGDVFLDIQPGKASDCWSGGQYHHHPDSPYGRGIDDAADIQEWESEALSIKIEHAQRDSVGITFYKDNAGIDQSKMVGGANVKVSLPDPEADINKSVMQLNPNPASGSLDTTIEMGDQMMKGMMGAYDVLSGSNENVPDTATGISLQQEKAVGIQGQFLARWAASWCIWALQGLRWAKKYQSEEQFLPYTDPGDPEAGEWFRASDLDTDYVIEAESDSWMPRTRLDAIADFERMVTLLGALAPFVKDPSQLPDVTVIFSHYAELLGVPTDVDAIQKDKQVAMAIIDKVKAGVAFYEKQPELPDPQVMMEKLLSMPGIQGLPKMGSATVFVQAVQDELKDLLDTDTPKDQPSDLLIQAMFALVDAGKQAVIAEAQEKGQIMQAAAQPALDAQKEAEGPPPEDKKAEAEAIKAQSEAGKTQAEDARTASTQEHEKATQEAEHSHTEDTIMADMASQEAQRQADAAEAEAQRRFEMEKLEREQAFEREQETRKMTFEKQQMADDRKTEMEKAKMDNANAIKLAKAKPAPKAPSGKK